MKNIYITRVKAFTLIELMVVIGILMTMITMSFGSSYVMRDQIEFRNATQSVSAMLRNARNLALSGQSYTDVGDFDQDESITDQVLPNGYIVNVDASTILGPVTIELYADLHVEGSTNTLDTSDILIESIDLPVDIFAAFLAEEKGGSGVTLSPLDNLSLIYMTPDAQFNIIDDSNTISDISVQIQLMQNDEQGEIMRDTYVYMNYMYGTPEVLRDAYVTP